MRDASALPTMTVEEYFRFEEASPVKHEYVAGEVYLIVDHRRRRVERHWRDALGSEWRREEIVGEGQVRVPCLDVDLSLDEIYERVEVPLVGEPEPVGHEVDGYGVDGVAS